MTESVRRRRLQLLSALDHLGALGLPREPVSVARVGGALLAVVGVVLVRRG